MQVQLTGEDGEEYAYNLIQNIETMKWPDEAGIFIFAVPDDHETDDWVFLYIESTNSFKKSHILNHSKWSCARQHSPLGNGATIRVLYRRHKNGGTVRNKEFKTLSGSRPIPCGEHEIHHYL